MAMIFMKMIVDMAKVDSDDDDADDMANLVRYRCATVPGS